MKAQKIFIKEPYYTIGSDEMSYYYQSKDTLYVYNCDQVITGKPKSKYVSHYKIWDVIEKSPNYLAVKLETLDSLIMSENPYPENRFSINIFKRINTNELSLERRIWSLRNNEMKDYPIVDSLFVNDFGSVFFSQSYVERFSKLKEISTKDDVGVLLKEMDSKENKQKIKTYENSNMSLFISGFMETLISKACIKLGYNPINATIILGKLVSEYPLEKKESN